MQEPYQTVFSLMLGLVVKQTVLAMLSLLTLQIAQYGNIEICTCDLISWIEKLEDRVSQLKAKIKLYVESDPSAFYTIEEFERAITLQTTAEETVKNETEESSPENKENRRGGGFGNGKSIINVALERLENLKAQFDGTAEKSTLSGQPGGGMGFDRGQRMQ